MTLSVSGVNCATPVSNVKAAAISANNIHFKGNEDLKEDVVELTKSDLSTRDKQKIIKKHVLKLQDGHALGEFSQLLIMDCVQIKKLQKNLA